MPHPAGPQPTEPDDRFEVIWFTFTVAGYLALMMMTEGPRRPAGSQWIRLLGANGMLLIAGAWLLIRRATRFGGVLPLFGGGRRLWPGLLVVVVALGLLAWVAFVWPDRGRPLEPSGWVRLGLVLMLVPLTEELFFRGALLVHLQRTVGAVPALLLVTALFGLLHYPAGQHFPMLALSAILCAVTLATGSLLWALAGHVGWNGAALAATVPAGSSRWIVVVFSALVVALIAARAVTTAADRAAPERD